MKEGTADIHLQRRALFCVTHTEGRMRNVGNPDVFEVFEQYNVHLVN